MTTKRHRVDFIVNQDLIAATQCENRDKPELHCNGKCVLMQKLQLKPNEDKPAREMPELLRLEIAQFTCEKTLELDLTTLDSLQKTPFPNTNEALVKPFASSVFHPPRQLV